MVMNIRNIRNILGRDESCLPRMLIGDNSVEMNDAVEHNDAESDWRPVGLLDRCDDTTANMIVVCCWIWDIACEARNGLKQVGARHDSDKLISAHDR